MPLIALIEKDPMQQEMLSNLLHLHNPEFQVLNFSSGKSFIDASEHLKIDLLITELHLSDIDGLEIIQTTQKEGYTIPVIALASNDSDFQHMARQLGAIDTFEKPVDPDKLLSDVNRLLKLHQLDPLYNMTIESILQIVSGDKKDCTLTLLSENQKGLAYFRSGQLIHASTQTQQGEAALVEMLGWNLHHFSTSPIHKEIPATIQNTLISILMDAAVNKDENGGELPTHLN